jgi:hypothetical protein
MFADAVKRPRRAINAPILAAVTNRFRFRPFFAAEVVER